MSQRDIRRNNTVDQPCSSKQADQQLLASRGGVPEDGQQLMQNEWPMYSDLHSETEAPIQKEIPGGKQPIRTEEDKVKVNMKTKPRMAKLEEKIKSKQRKLKTDKKQRKETEKLTTIIEIDSDNEEEMQPTHHATEIKNGVDEHSGAKQPEEANEDEQAKQEEQVKQEEKTRKQKLL